MKTSIQNILTNKRAVFILFAIIVCIQLFLYLFLYQRANWITPPGHVHALANFDSFYPDVIRQSKLGAWSYQYAYSTLPSPQVYTFLFFIALGKIAAVFHIDPVMMYEVSRVIGSIAVFISTYWLITLVLPAAVQIPALLLTIALETGPVWDTVLHSPVGQWTTTFFVNPMITRNFTLSHHLWSEALGLMLFCVIIRAVRKPSPLDLLFITILSVAGTLTNPTFNTILVVCVFAPWLLYAAVTKTLKRTFLPIAFASAAYVFVGLFTLSQFSSGSRWNTLTALEKSWWSTGDILQSFFQSYSLFFPFVAVLLILTLFSWKQWSQTVRRTFILCICWGFLPIVLIILAGLPWTPLVNGRIVTDLSTVPFGILSSLVFYAASQMSWFHRSLKIGMTGLFIVISGLSILLSVVYVKQIIHNQDVAVFSGGNSFVEYPTINLWNGVMALRNVPVWSHILVNPRITMIIPEYVPVQVYQGITSEGPDWSTRRGLSYQFFRGDMPRVELLKLLKENDISYVFYGPEEKAATVTLSLYPDILLPTYTNPDVTIYKVSIKL